MKVEDLIVRDLITATPNETVEDVKERMSSLGVHALPIVDDLGTAVGIVTASDLEGDLPGDTPVTDLMSDQVFEIHPENDARDAARLMRDQGTHHLVVTVANRAVAMLSSFDLLRVVEES